MSVSTTLMTFLVRTPPSTRSVSLYGSWDNFSQPYGMQRDTKLGLEHWSGCHSFSNIICDGNLDGNSTIRNGGLKMGGTYWYYYQLDNAIEFHNSSEPSTTACPLLPGQLVNVLQVPIVLSGNRSRSNSFSSTSSDNCTLDPTDKYMNPRPVPEPQRKLRLNTSPTMASFADDTTISPETSTISRSAVTITTPKLFRLPRKASVDAFMWAKSSSKSETLRNAFRIRGARSQSPEVASQSGACRNADQDTAQETRVNSAEQGVTSSQSNSEVEQTARPRRGLPLRSISDDGLRLNSFQQHRRQRSRQNSTTRGNPSPQQSIDLEDSMTTERTEPLDTKKHPLSTLKEVASVQNTPDCHEFRNIGIGNTGNLLLEKRLPTLPNTPSSAYPASLIQNSPSNRVSIRIIDGLESRFSNTTIDTEPVITSAAYDQSHFSMTTIDTDSCTNSMTIGKRSHLWNWSRNTSVLSPAETIFEDYPMGNLPEQILPPTHLSLTSSCNTMSSTAATSPTTSFFGSEAYTESRISDTDSSSKPSTNTTISHYSLLDDEYASAITLKQPNSRDYDQSNLCTIRTPSPPSGQRQQYDSDDSNKEAILHSESMQQLLDELSYLSGMIRH